MGITAPGGAYTTFMPLTTFGAPQTTSTTLPPTSTLHNFSLSALGCFSSLIT